MKRQISLGLIICVLFTSFAGQLNPRIASASLITVYPFGGRARDVSSIGNDGIVSGARLTEDFESMAYEFDGLDDFIEIPANIGPNVLPHLDAVRAKRPKRLLTVLSQHEVARLI